MRKRRFVVVAVAGAALGLVAVQLASVSGAGAQPNAVPALGPLAAASSHTMPGGTAMAAPAGRWIEAPAQDQVRGVTPSRKVPDQSPTHHEFQANCSVTHTGPNDPIVFPGQTGASHDHTFLGNPSVNANTTIASLRAATTTCKVPEDKSAYWMPTMLDGDRPVLPDGPQVIYYKSGVFDYTSVRPFPTGMRYVVSSPSATMAQFAAGSVEGYECGDSSRNYDFTTMTNCPAGSHVNVRYQAPSCWDGVHLDSPDHQSHIVYPVTGPDYGRKVCPSSHPVAVPMLEFKMAFPIDGNVSRARLSSGRGYSFHYDFMNAWDPATLRALSDHCIVGGLQCNTRGFDQYKPARGAALTADHRLP